MRQFVPPSKRIIKQLITEFLSKGRLDGSTFDQFITKKGYGNRSKQIFGMDDGSIFKLAKDDQVARCSPVVHTKPIKLVVLLVDFHDRPGRVPKSHYRGLFFSDSVVSTDSVASYYNEVSRGKVEITGNVYGWLRMPNDYSYYCNRNSGLGDDDYPANPQRLVQDALYEAVESFVPFESTYLSVCDSFNTFVVIVHSGYDAADTLYPLNEDEIWSHQWELYNKIEIVPGLLFSKYCIVSHDTTLGTATHELGHLLFQWGDFYDPNIGATSDAWDGNGLWDLMAGGNYAGPNGEPVHPAGIHKLEQGWIDIEEVTSTRKNVVLSPVTNNNGKLIKIKGPNYTDSQYLIVENRAWENFDTWLQGEGILVWRVDDTLDMESPKRPKMYLVQADGQHDLDIINDANQGDDGDPFPGSTHKTSLGDYGDISTMFPDAIKPSGVSITNIQHIPDTKDISFDINISP